MARNREPLEQLLREVGGNLSAALERLRDCNRLEIISPGRLPNGITPERMRAGTRAARNQLLKDVMRDYHYLEHMGMGIPRKIIAGMRRHGKPSRI
jgi:predicted HTH transcriptional regulator